MNRAQGTRGGACLRFLAWLAPALLAMGCSSLPVVATPTTPVQGQGQPRLEQASVIGKDGALSPGKGAAEIRDVQDEGRRELAARHVAILSGLGESMTADNEVKLLIDGPATFKAMFASMRAAKQSIQMESYIFEDESVGEEVASILKERAAAGVKVNLIYDALGSLSTSGSFFDELEKSGVAVCQFNPVNPLIMTKAIRFNNRDHRKMLIVDGREAFTGGINVSGKYSSGSSSPLKKDKEEDKKEDAARNGEAAATAGKGETAGDKDQEHGWRDTHVSIKGPAVADFSALYVDTWQRQGCDQPPAPVPRQATPAGGDRLVTVLGSKPGDAEPRIYRSLLSAIGGAQRSVHLTMAYFVPDPQTVRFLTDAARRGVDVTLILQGKSDSTLVMRAGQSHYDTLLQAGVKLYERSDTLLHAKTAVIDGVWTSVGTSNVDWRSFLHNDEVNVIILGAEFGSEMERLFQRDLTHAHQITPGIWSERGYGRRFMEWMGRLFEYWL